MAQTLEKKHPKVVRSDLKDVKPEKPPVLMHHDLEETPPSRKDRWREPLGGRSDHVPHAAPRGDNERRGGRDRQERKRRHVGSAAS